MELRALVLWLVATALGEALGITCSALFGAAATGVVGPNMTPMGSYALVICGGVLEGACLGGLQAWALRQTALGPSPWKWFVATAGGMGLAWSGAGLVGELLTSLLAPADSLSAVGLILGVSIGAILGTSQAIVLRRTHHAFIWVLASMLAWSVGMVVLGVGSAAIPAGDWTLGHFLLLASTGLASGACIGALSSSAWAWPKASSDSCCHEHGKATN